MSIILPHKITTALSNDLPGWKGQSLLSSSGYDLHRTERSDSKKAAVMLLLYPEDDGSHKLIYIKRPSHNLNDKHSGQISFPGGKVEANDATLKATALRETYEEIGVQTSSIQVLGALSKLYVFVSDFIVFPFVGYLEREPTFVAQTSEVDKIITFPLENLIRTTPSEKDIQVRNHRLKNVPYYNLSGEILWGATAMITSEFLELLRSNAILR